MAMAGPVQKAASFGPSFRRLIGRLTPHRGRLAVITVLAVVSVACSVVGPRLLGDATDVVVAAVGPAVLDRGGLERYLLASVAVYVVSSVLLYGQGVLLNRVVQRTVQRLRSDVEDKVHRLPLSRVDSTQRGDLLSRVTNDIDNVSQSLQQTLSQALTSVLTVVGVVAFMFSISWELAIVALLAIPLTLAVTTVVAKRSQPLFTAQWRETGILNGQIEEAFTGHDVVTAFGRREEVRARFASKNEELFTASAGAQFLSGTIMPATTFVGNLVYVGIAVLGGTMVTNGSLSIGGVQAFIQYSRQFTQPLSQLGSMANLLQSGVASAERVFELLDEDELSPEPAVEPARPDGETGPGAGRIEFEHVSFRYSPDRPLIDDLSFVAEPGQTVAVVGPTGAGKTTLVNLLLRFYEVGGGRILLDGVDTATMSRGDLRSRAAIVLQDTWLFSGTIRENIAYGRPGATDEEIVAAARAASVDRFVRSLPEGYDTHVDEDATRVSAGEKQLITIARAFLARPGVLVLDEATSSVDTRTERLVQQAMTELRRDRTSLVIAHRLSTIRDADLILVMRDGRVVEQGRHEDLLAAQGAYAALYHAQFAGPAVEGDAVEGDAVGVDAVGSGDGTGADAGTTAEVTAGPAVLDPAAASVTDVGSAPGAARGDAPAGGS
ncbi:ABC transporter ATP-binding protein [Kineosporiaceae bacterium B12]|nr:ABC transporter ATP-binding protein [Kineococcus rubinsiae]